MVNVCPHNATFRNVEVGDSVDGEFFLRTVPPDNFVLEPGGERRFRVAYRPRGEGADRGSIFVEQVGPAEPFLFTMKGQAAPGEAALERFEAEVPRVDVLWVIDNGGYMAQVQSALAGGLDAFLTHARALGVGYRIGVTTSGVVPAGNCPGGANGGEAGRLFPVDNSHPRILTAATPELESHWIASMLVGTCHDSAELLEAMYLALTPPLIDSCDDTRPSSPQPNDGNCDFLRDDARLAVSAVTEGMDGSPNQPSFCARALAAVKGAGNPDLVAFHAIGRDDFGDCRGNGVYRLSEMARRTGGTTWMTCTANWNALLTGLSAAVFGTEDCYQLTNRPRDVDGDGALTSELLVKVNGVPISAGSGDATKWTYREDSGTICFAPLRRSEPGSQVTVEYTRECASW
jgi:hypothetical protein